MWIDRLEPLLDFSNAVAAFGVNFLAQSTLLIVAGLIAARLAQSKGAAFQAAILRATLVAVIACPLASLGLSAAGVQGLALRLPAGTLRQAKADLPAPATPLAASPDAPDWATMAPAAEAPELLIVER